MNNKKIDALQTGLTRQFGSSVSRASLTKSLKVIPTGILALDLALGTGGWPIGFCHGIYGPRDIGKSSIIGLNAIREAQKLDKVPVIVAVEPPGLDPAWAMRHGVDPDQVVVVYPETGEEAFDMTHKIITSGNADLVVFDSVGAILGESESKEGGTARQGGQAGLITWGMKKIAPVAYKYDVCVLMMNQVRDNMQARIPGAVQQPGGKALEHHEQIILRLRRGADKFTLKMNGEDVVVGRQIIGVVERNKAHDGEGQKAIFNFFSADTGGEYPFGIDLTADVIATGKRTGAIKQAGAYYDLPNGQRIQGQKAVGEYLEKNPDVLEIIREEVLKYMVAGNSRTELEVVVDGA